MKLTNPDDVSHFEVGERYRIEDLSEADARAIFGDAVYEQWKKYRDEPSVQGSCMVTGIDRTEPTIRVSTSASPKDEK